MTGVCALCAASGPVAAHHLAGRCEPGGRYYDPALVIQVCPACHTGAGGLHPTLRTVRLDFPPVGAHPVAHRLRRVALHAVVMADAGRPFALGPKSARGLAVLLREAADGVQVPR